MMRSESPLPQAEVSAQDRASPRTSMFLLATMCRVGSNFEIALRVRNLSATGLCGDSNHQVEVGERITITLGTIGEVKGEIVWCDGDRFGVAFATEIDPARAKRKSSGEEAKAQILPPVLDYRRPGLNSFSGSR